MMCSYKKSRDGGVSPVVGVMLMLVVVIIIAAVVSAFAGGLAKGSDKAPTVAMDVTIKNTGVWTSSYIQFDVKSVSESFSSGDLKIITSWTNSSGGTGGSTVMKGLNAPNTQVNLSAENSGYQSPLGFGPTVTNWKTSSPYPAEQQFGNYSITAGTTMKTTAYGYNTDYGGYGVTTPYTYTMGSAYTGAGNDGMQAILGNEWSSLKSGDTVKVLIMHIPSGKTIFNKNVPVVG